MATRWIQSIQPWMAWLFPAISGARSKVALLSISYLFLFLNIFKKAYFKTKILKVNTFAALALMHAVSLDTKT